MRTVFHNQLAELAAQLSEMCARAGAAMDTATRALLQADLVLAENVITGHDHLTAMRTQLEENAVVLLALQAPVAGDLRAVVSALQHAADIERMGGLAAHVAKIARRRHPNHVLPTEVNDSFDDMGHLAVELATGAHDVLISADPAKAARIRHDDDAMDELHRHLFTVLMDNQWEHGVAAAVDVTLLGRFYERFADHTVEIARRVIFAKTGHLPDDETLRTAAT
jgi:phosphate transport system protein